GGDRSRPRQAAERTAEVRQGGADRGDSTDLERQNRLQGALHMSASPSLDKLLAAAPYSLSQKEKRAILADRTRELTQLHYERCEPYRNLVDRIFGGARVLQFERLEDAPFLPVSLFKTRELRSVEAGE